MSVWSVSDDDFCLSFPQRANDKKVITGKRKKRLKNRLRQTAIKLLPLKKYNITPIHSRGIGCLVVYRVNHVSSLGRESMEGIEDSHLRLTLIIMLKSSSLRQSV